MKPFLTESQRRALYSPDTPSSAYSYLLIDGPAVHGMSINSVFFSYTQIRDILRDWADGNTATEPSGYSNFPVVRMRVEDYDAMVIAPKYVTIEVVDSEGVVVQRVRCV